MLSIKKHIVIALSAILLLTGGAIASAQTSTTTTDTSGTVTTPGTPNTGAGGDSTMNWLILGATGLAVLGGVGYLARRPSHTNNN